MKDHEKEALQKWYKQEWLLGAIRRAYEEKNWDGVEALIHRDGLFPLGRHSELPDYMRAEDGKPLFPTNLNPHNDMEGWQAAVEIGWEVARSEFGILRDKVQGEIRKAQDEDWDLFMKSVEERKRKRGE